MVSGHMTKQTKHDSSCDNETWCPSVCY